MIDKSKFKDKMADCLRISKDRLEDQAVLSNLVSDSFVLVDMVIELQEEFGVHLVQEHLKSVKTVADLIRVFEEQEALG